DGAGECVDVAAFTPLALGEGLAGRLERGRRELDLDLAARAACDGHDAAIGELGREAEQLPRRGNRRGVDVADLRGLSGILGRPHDRTAAMVGTSARSIEGFLALPTGTVNVSIIATLSCCASSNL